MDTQINTIALLEEAANLATGFVIFGILTMASFFQFAYHELPCPLCLLQRAGFAGMLVGILLNLRYGFKPSHYGIVLISGILTAFIALRQIALHVIPGTGAYGTPFLGLHFYTWAFIVAMALVFVVTIMLSLDRQYDFTGSSYQAKFKTLYTLLFLLVLGILLVNLVSTGLECGLSACPDNPTTYKL